MDNPSAKKTTQTEALQEIEGQIGFVPNVLRELSASPVTPLIYTRTDALMHDQASLTQQEQQFVQLVASLFNDCNYCSSMHSKFSEINGATHADVLAIRDGKAPKDERLASLAWTTQTILDKRGHLSDDDLAKIQKMGITRAELYEILVHIGRKMIANYAVHIIKPELDEQFVFVE